MVKEFKPEGTQCMLMSTDNVMSSVPCTNNFEKSLSLQNQIEYLAQEFDSDQKKLGKLLFNAFVGREKFIKRELIATGAAVVSGVACYLAAQSVPVALGTGFSTCGIISLFSYISFWESNERKKISGYTECTEYEKALLKAKKQELAKLSNESNHNDRDMNNKADIYEVNNEELEKIKEAIKLRYYYGFNKKRIIGMYRKGILLEVLKSLDYSDEVIAEFIIYIEGVVTEIDRAKENKKYEAEMKRMAFKRRVSDFFDDF